MNNDDFNYKVGRFLGAVLLGCVAACLCGISIGLTVKFILWML